MNAVALNPILDARYVPADREHPYHIVVRVGGNTLLLPLTADAWADAWSDLESDMLAVNAAFNRHERAVMDAEERDEAFGVREAA